jgi:hypothetical protein
MTLHKVYVFIPQLESKMAKWFIQVQMDCQTLSHIVVRVHIAMNRVQTHNFSGDILFLNGMIPGMQIKVISIGPSQPV